MVTMEASTAGSVEVYFSVEAVSPGAAASSAALPGRRRAIITTLLRMSGYVTSSAKALASAAITNNAVAPGCQLLASWWLRANRCRASPSSASYAMNCRAGLDVNTSDGTSPRHNDDTPPSLTIRLRAAK